jgi:hypothetical protein
MKNFEPQRRSDDPKRINPAFIIKVAFRVLFMIFLTVFVVV